VRHLENPYTSSDCHPRKTEDPYPSNSCRWTFPKIASLNLALGFAMKPTDSEFSELIVCQQKVLGKLMKKPFILTVGLSTLLLITGCTNSAIQSDWDELSSGAQDEICYGVAEFGADTAAGLEYTLNSEYSKEDLADFLRGEC